MKNESNSLACSLTSPHLRKRKQTVITSLKEKVISRKEVSNGYAYQFKNTDEVLDELLLFVKTERQCCTFFTFTLTLNNEGGIGLELSGPDGAKDFIDTEVEL